MKKFNRKKISIIALISVFMGVTSNAYSAETIDASLPKPQVKSVHKEEQHKGDEHKSEEGHDEHSEAKGHDEHSEDDEHDGETEDKGHTESEEGITLSPEKMSIANITVESILPKMHFNTVYAPGEVKVNGYKSYVVSPRTESVVLSRHATLGEHVEIGQKLVTLFSESMVQAQADYLIASTEWQRVKKLGNKTVSESRLLQAETEFSAAYGKLLALGLTDKAIKNISYKDLSLFGQYSLVAEREGVVLQDDFLQGQRVNAGDTIMLLANERELWVEAKVTPSKKLNLSINSPAFVNLGGQDYEAKVIQEAHTIDPITRTRIVRLSVTNKDDNLHSGMFVKVNFQFETDTQVMAVPEEALIRGTDGDWTVFVEDHPGEFNAIEVELGQTFGDYREIIGLPSGSKVVTKGAFFVASEIAKGGFDPHNH